MVKRTGGKKTYILVHRNWQYNDEYYYQPDGGGGTPVHSFTNREDAEKEKERLEAEEASFSREIAEGMAWAEGFDGDVAAMNVAGHEIDADLYEIVEVEAD